MTEEDASTIRAALDRYEAATLAAHASLSSALADIVEEVDKLEEKINEL